MGLFDGLKKMVIGTPANSEESISSDNTVAMKLYTENVDRINALEPKYESMTRYTITPPNPRLLYCYWKH